MFCACVTSWTRCWSLLAILWATFWHPRCLQNIPRELQEPSKSAPRGFQWRPISPWKPPLSRSGVLKSSKKTPRGLQGLPGTPPGLPGTPPKPLPETPKMLNMDPRRVPRDLPEASSSTRPSIQLPRPHFWTVLGQGPLAQDPRPGGMRVSD